MVKQLSNFYQNLKRNIQAHSSGSLIAAIVFFGSSIVSIQVLSRNDAGEPEDLSRSNLQTASRVNQERVNESGVLPVVTTSLELADSYSSYQTYTGETIASRSSEMGFERGGRLVRVFVNEGDRISIGTPLAKLDTSNLDAQRQGLIAQKSEAQALLAELNNGATPEEIDSAQAQVRDLEQQLELENIRATRREYLFSQGAVNREELEEITFNAKALAERLSDARSNLKQRKNGSRVEQIDAQRAVVDRLLAEINALDITIANSTLLSPFEGIVSVRNFDEGSIISSGQSVLRLVENSQLKVKIGVPPKVATQLQVDSTQRLTISSRQYEAKVVSILPEVNSSTRNLTAVFELGSTDVGQVLPQQIARLKLIRESEREGYWLPISALTKGERGLWSCYALDKSGKQLRVERRLVELLETQNQQVFVRGTLQPGDEIVVKGTHRLIPGQVVTASNEG